MSQYFGVNKSHTKYNTATSGGDNDLKGLFLLYGCTFEMGSELTLVTCRAEEQVTKDTLFSRSLSCLAA